MNIYFSKTKASYVAQQKDINESCNDCGNFLLGVFFLKTAWFLKKRNQKKPSQEKFYCAACVDNLKNRLPGDYTDFKLIVILKALPNDAVPVFKNPPSTQVSRSTESIFDLADDDSVSVNKDYTKLSGRENIEGATIGNPDLAFIEEKDQELSEDDGLDLLGDLFGASQQIGEDEKKKIEEKKEEKQNGETKQNTEAVTDGT